MGALLDAVGELEEDAAFGDDAVRPRLSPLSDFDLIVLLGADGHRALRELAGLDLARKRTARFSSSRKIADTGTASTFFCVRVWITASTNMSFFSSPCGILRDDADRRGARGRIDQRSDVGDRRRESFGGRTALVYVHRVAQREPTAGRGRRCGPAPRPWRRR